MLARYEEYQNTLDEQQLEPVLKEAAGGRSFYNFSFFDLRRLSQDADNLV
ncbi:MAG: hypothetical protein JXA25_07435 [Anaerolineales bacterium]|nr:hypothetical protein [Anaerolineales bacterium]